ncbi:MAG: hypothetical protein WKG07_29050 [Hymenobacter sp.]
MIRRQSPRRAGAHHLRRRQRQRERRASCHASHSRACSAPRPGGSTNTTSIMHNKFVVIDAENSNPSIPMGVDGLDELDPGRSSATDRNNVIDHCRTRPWPACTPWSLRKCGVQQHRARPAPSLFGSRKTDNTPHFSAHWRQARSSRGSRPPTT